MKSGERTVALVGRPNVGKSRLFNALAKRRIAIVHDQPGVTRDVHAVEIDGLFTLLDTGGIGLAPGMGEEALVAATEEQVFFAVAAADLILFVVDGRSGPTDLDARILDRLRSAGKDPILVVNKIDRPQDEDRAWEFSSFGISDIMAVSAEHNLAIEDLRDLVEKRLGPPPAVAEEEVSALDRRVSLAFVGRPNVGKSSLCNRLMEADRLVVSEVPGTTRDTVSLNLDFTDDKQRTWHYRLLDTAGLRRQKRMSSSVEFFSSLRSQEALREADVVFHILDALEGVTRQDKAIGGEILEAGRPCAVIVNKWDLALEQFAAEGVRGYATEREFREAFEAAARREMFYLPGSTFLFVSAKTGFSVDRILRHARDLDARAGRTLATPKLNRAIAEIMTRREPRVVDGKRFRVYYAVQIGTRPVAIRLFGNRASKLEESYRRYLENNLIERFALGGCPIRFEVVGKDARYAKTAPRRKR